MTRRARGASAARRIIRVETDSESDSDYDYTKMNSNVQKQVDIMMKDLGTATRNRITTTDHGRGGSLAVPAAALMRDCYLMGSEAAQIATQHQGQLAAWAGYHQTSEAKAAGGEALRDLNGGNTHRFRVRSQLREDGINNLQDTYFDPRSRRGGPPAGRLGRGAAAAIANDRGHFSHSRGGGFAGRGGGRGTAITNGRGNFGHSRGGGFAGRGGGRGTARGTNHSNAPASRPLDPALDPGREYTYNSKPSGKKPAQGNMGQGKVTPKPTNKPSQPAQYAPDRPSRRPPQAQSPVNHQLGSPDDFMNSVLALFKSQAEARNVVVPVSAQETAINISASTPQTATAAISSERAVGDVSTDVAKVQEPNITVQVKPAEREEIIQNEKSPDSFTDGQPSDQTLSGFSPSVGTGAEHEPASVEGSPAGLGITGAPVDESVDLMSVDTHGRNNTGLLEPLLASPKDNSSLSDEQVAEYKLLREYVIPKQIHDFAQWRAGRDLKDGGAKPSYQQDDQSSVAVNMTGGYTIGGGSLDRIIGDGRNVAAKPKPTQTTPSLMKSMWASPEAETLLDFKNQATLRLQGKPLTLEPVAEEQDLTPERASEVDSTSVSAALAPGDKANPFAPREASKLDSTTRGQSNADESSNVAVLSKMSNGTKGMAGSRWATAESQDKPTTEKTLKPATAKTASTSMWSDAKSKDVSSKSLEPVKPLAAKPGPVQLNSSASARNDKGLVTQASKQSVQSSKPLRSMSGLSSSMWSTKPGSSGSNSVSGFGASKDASVLGSIQTNVSQDAPKNTVTKETSRPKKEVRFEEPLPKASKTSDLPQRNPFAARPQASPAQTLPKSSSATPVATIFGDSRNLRKTASRGFQDPVSLAATAITKHSTGAVRSTAGRGQGRSDEATEKKPMAEVKVDEELEEGEIVEDGTNSVHMLTHQFGNMDLGRGKKR